MAASTVGPILVWQPTAQAVGNLRSIGLSRLAALEQRLEIVPVGEPVRHVFLGFAVFVGDENDLRGASRAECLRQASAAAWSRPD